MTSLQVAASSGSRLEALTALRDSLAIDLDACESMRDKAALSLRFMDTLAQIEEVERAAPPKKGTVLDELASRRAQPKPAPRSARTARSK